LTFTRRGKITIGVGAVVAILAGVGVLVLTGNTPAVLRNVVDTITGDSSPEPPPPPCPLTGLQARGGAVPERGVLAVKVENAPEARPQAGLEKADVIYEEPVEGGLTRFILLFQCADTDRVGPVRSARTTDPDVLLQYGTPPIAYSGSARKVRRAIAEADLVGLTESTAPGAFARDPSRSAPHNLYATTKRLYEAAETGEIPAPVFSFSRRSPGGRKVGSIHLNFSWSSDVYWSWSKRDRAWLRFHGDDAHVLESGDQVSVANVVVQVVEVHAGEIIDAAGNPSPEVTLTGSGKAFVFRDAQVVVGRWERADLSDITTFTTKAGEEIKLAPGRTWVELFPSTLDVETAKRPR